jgi:hypothetical protein
LHHLDPVKFRLLDRAQALLERFNLICRVEQSRGRSSLANWPSISVIAALALEIAWSARPS